MTITINSLDFHRTVYANGRRYPIEVVASEGGGWPPVPRTQHHYLTVDDAQALVAQLEAAIRQAGDR